MNIKNLSTTVLLGLSIILGMVSDSNAVSLNPEDRGQVLLFPYYTVRGGNDTFISVVNTTDQVKSVKVRFLEGVNSREVKSFNLYLSAFDVWVAALTESGENVRMVIPDSSCTVPYFFSDDVLESFENELDRLGETTFNNDRFTGAFDDPGPDELERLQSGHIEIIEMGVLTDLTQGSAMAATHVLTSFDDLPFELPRPAACNQLVEAWAESSEGEADNYWTNDAQIDHEPPSGGLRGTGTIINVMGGTMFSYTAQAIDGFSTEIMHFDPADPRPDLSSGNVTTSNVVFDNTVDTQTWQTSVEAVSATMLYDSIMNEYVVDPVIAGLSEWVVTFPTKHFYTDSLAPIGDVPVAPFSVALDGVSDCEPFDTRFWGRETGPLQIEVGPPTNGSPQPDRTFRICNTANVLRVTQDGILEDLPAATEILGEPRYSTLSVNTDNFLGAAQIVSGWLELDFATFDDLSRQTRSTVTGPDEDTGMVYNGLPAIGFWVNTYFNGAIGGSMVLANYAGTYRHSGHREASPAPASQ